MRTLLGDVIKAVSDAVQPFRERIGKTLLDFCEDLEDIAKDWSDNTNEPEE